MRDTHWFFFLKVYCDRDVNSNFVSFTFNFGLLRKKELTAARLYFTFIQNSNNSGYILANSVHKFVMFIDIN